MSMTRKMKFLILVAALLSLSGCGGSSSSGKNQGDSTALVSWTPPLENSDGSTLTDLEGYRIYYGNSPGDYDNWVTIDNTVTSYMIENLGKADWYFAMTAINSLGIESAYSDEVHKTID